MTIIRKIYALSKWKVVQISSWWLYITFSLNLVPLRKLCEASECFSSCVPGNNLKEEADSFINPTNTKN